ncbi:AAA family ATPase [Cloacibacillus evryensis]|uniref:AAA family ATPase n=1 Tax=Cloacibacillus evryensis TaxID=508460 RepID=UPI00210961F8|nr:ATP-binding protein [Cloacibacillus evryensis]MCQ4762625.1 ATP-binding protein [Cloacibacillus evryensis]
MLIQFNFKNYKSFRDDTILDMSATPITEYGGHVVEAAHEKILPVAGIFGANASGKSNVHDAFRYMTKYVVNSFAYGDSDGGKGTAHDFTAPTPFSFDKKTKDAESTFEVYFLEAEENGGRSYKYGFAVDKKGVSEEWLSYKAKSSRGDFRKIFHRDRTALDLSGIAASHHENIKIALEDKTLVVSLGAKLKVPKLKLVRDWFLSNEFADFGDPVENYFLSERLPARFLTDKEVRNKVVGYFSSFDPSIVGFNIETFKGDNDKQFAKIDALHKMVDSDEVVAIPLKLESAGTLKMFALYPPLQKVLESGGTLFIDELNARLHPLLVRAFIITFLNPVINVKHAQLVFTAHDAWQLNANILRRDEVWFTEKMPDGASALFSLVDFVDESGMKIRKDENYEKNYLLGKYGAIPTLKCLDMFQEAADD